MHQLATVVVSLTGIGEEERRHRRASNMLTTKITFVGWLLEVSCFLSDLFTSCLLFFI